MSSKDNRRKSGSEVEPEFREEARAAFERVRPRLDGVAPDAAMRSNLHPTRAIGIVLAAEPKIAAMIPQIRRQLPEFPIEQIQELRDLALAAYYAIHRPVATEEETKLGARIAALVAEGTELRQTLQLEAEALARRRLLPPEQVTALRGGRGHSSVADALVALSSLFRDRWKEVKSKTATTVEDIARAQQLSLELVEVLGSRAISQTRETATHEGRRALALLVQAYDEIRSAVLYLRRKEKDGSTIAPSLYLGPRRRRGRAEELEASPESPAPTTPTT